MRRSAAFIALMFLFGTDVTAQAQSADACRGGTFSIVNAPDGSSLSILFDDFSVAAGPESGEGAARRFCNLEIPLNLPEGYSLGVYRVDYRGFARLSSRQHSELSVDYGLGRRNKGRRYHRRIRGAYEGEFVFSERIGAGLMKRVGCGEAAVLNAAITLELQTRRAPEEATVALDSIDGAAQGGLIYRFDLRKCGK